MPAARFPSPRSRAPRIPPLVALLAALVAASPGPVAAAPAGLGPCAREELGPGAECGQLEVPEDPDRPDGRRLEIHVTVLRATGEALPEPVFLLAGGPGQAAGDLAELALGPLAPVRERRDLVLVDLRGTGRSGRTDCPNGSADDPQAAFGGLFDPAWLADCLERTGGAVDLDHLNNPHAIADLEAARRWLGYERILLWGGSGGTRTALVYMRRHPERVAAALLDGVTPPDFGAPAPFAPAAQEALERVFADCAAQPACRQAYPDLPGDFRRLLARFAAGPVDATVEHREGSRVAVRMQAGDFAYAVRGLLYGERGLVRLPAMIHAAAASGDLSPFAQALWQRDVAVRPVVAMGVHLAVYCTEDLPHLDLAAARRRAAGTFLGTYLLDQYGAACATRDWRPVDAADLEPVRSTAPVLLFSGHYDPSTPAEIAEAAAAHLPASRHLVVRNAGHGAEFGCGREPAVDFLLAASLDGLGPVCEGVGALEFAVE